MGFSEALGGLSAHFTTGPSQLLHWRSVRPERVTTGIIRFPHFGQRVVRSMRSSRFFTRNRELELLFHPLRPNRRFRELSIASCSTGSPVGLGTQAQSPIPKPFLQRMPVQ